LRTLLAAALIVMVAGNLALLGLTGVARLLVDQPGSPRLEGVGALRTVDAKVLRGANPTHAGIVNLQDHGVTTVVDLRAEDDAHEDDVFIKDQGLGLVHLPIRDGQTPSDEQVAEFFDVVQQADGLVFVHCGAGVGRTGVMSARYLVATGQATPMVALARNLEVGPPSVEQDAFSLGVDAGPFQPALVTVSRFLDAPRRIWHYL
jgi:protein-tyrosine phosphatase